MWILQGFENHPHVIIWHLGFKSSHYAVVTELLGKEYKENVTTGILALGAFADLLGNPVGGRTY